MRDDHCVFALARWRQGCPLAGSPGHLARLAVKKSAVSGERRHSALTIHLQVRGTPAPHGDIDHEPDHERAVAGPLPNAIEAIAAEAAVCLRVDRSRLAVAEAFTRELLINAIGHRSYRPDLLDRPVLVSVWPDALEITSPGGLAGHADADGVVIAGRAIRNPTLFALLWRMGRVRQQGTGMADLVRYADLLGWRPRFSDEGDAVRVRVELWPRTAGRVPPPWRRQRLSREDVAGRIVTLLRGREAMSAAHIAVELEVPRPTVRAALGLLMLEGRVVQTRGAPSSPDQRYRLQSPSDPTEAVRGRDWPE